MKKLLFTTALLIVSSTLLFSQTRFGVKAGVNFANQEFEYDGASVTPSSVTSFHIHGLMDYQVSSTFSFQPAIGISGKGFKSELDGEDGKLNLLYLDIPLNIVAKFPVPKMGKLFLGAGPYAAFGISGKATADGESEDDVFSDEGYKRSDFGINLLGGVELSQGLTLNANYGLGLANIIDSEGSGLSVKNKVFSLSLGFLF